tara:strand:+ start:11014 stop:11223 length:210 start_codon:yes stop_codon:yes gene_type:complete
MDRAGLSSAGLCSCFEPTFFPKPRGHDTLQQKYIIFCFRISPPAHMKDGKLSNLKRLSIKLINKKTFSG